MDDVKRPSLLASLLSMTLFFHKEKGSPAELIKALREGMYPYEVVNEVTVNGKVMEATIHDQWNNKAWTFYRLERCEQILNAEKAKKDRELTRYK